MPPASLIFGIPTCLTAGGTALMVVSLPQACLNSAPPVQNAGQQLHYHAKVAVCKYPRCFYPPGAPPFRYRSKGSGRAAQQQRPHLRADLGTDLSLAALPCQGGAAAALSHCTGAPHTPHSLPKSFCTRAGSPEGLGAAVCLPSADKSHLSRPFLPNIEQYLAQGSYLNVDLQHKAETDLFSLQQQ